MEQSHAAGWAGVAEAGGAGEPLPTPTTPGGGDAPRPAPLSNSAEPTRAKRAPEIGEDKENPTSGGGGFFFFLKVGGRKF